MESGGFLGKAAKGLGAMIGKSRWMVPALLLLLLLSYPPVSRACSVDPPDPWFSEALLLGETELPDGVEIVAVRDDDRPPDELQITNSSPVPLYILGETFFDDEIEPLPVELPPDIAPVYKIVSDRAFSWDYVFEDEAPADKGWVEEHEPARVVADTGAIYSWHGEPIMGLNFRNQSWEVRPAEVVFPAPQETELHLVYGKERLTVPLTVLYILNPDYDPESVERAEGGCGNMFSLLFSTEVWMMLLCLMTLLMMVVVATIGLSRMEKN